MNSPPQPLSFLLAFYAGWVNRHQQRVVEYLVAENKILKRQLGKRRLRLDDGERRRLARLGKALGRFLNTELSSSDRDPVAMLCVRRSPRVRLTTASEQIRGVVGSNCMRDSTHRFDHPRAQNRLPP